MAKNAKMLSLIQNVGFVVESRRCIRMSAGISVLIVTATAIVVIDHLTASLAVGDRRFGEYGSGKLGQIELRQIELGQIELGQIGHCG
jgi:hypothetical protein